MTVTDLILFFILVFLAGSLFFFYYLNLQVRNRALASELIEERKQRDRKLRDVPDDMDRIHALETLLLNNDFPFDKFGKALRLNGRNFYGLSLKEGINTVDGINRAREILRDTGWSCAYTSFSVIQDEQEDRLIEAEFDDEEVLALAAQATLDAFTHSVDSWLETRDMDESEIKVPKFRKNLREFQTGVLTFFPVPHTWQILAFWDFGNVNTVPKHGEVLRILEYFERNYAAEMVFFTPMVMELQVGRPPEDKPSALRLAIEQGRFCPDIYQIHFSNEKDAAAHLMNNPWWYFWWD